MAKLCDEVIKHKVTFVGEITSLEEMTMHQKLAFIHTPQPNLDKLYKVDDEVRMDSCQS